MTKLSCTLSAALLAVLCMASSAQAREKAAVQPCDEGQKPPCVDGKSVAGAAKVAAADSGALKAKKARYVEKIKSCKGFDAGATPVFSGGENAHTIKACCGANDKQFSIRCTSCGCGPLSGSGCDCCEQRDPSKIDWNKVNL